MTDHLPPPHVHRRPGCGPGSIAALDPRGIRQVFLVPSAALSADRFEPPRRHASPPIRTPQHGGLAMRSLLTILPLLTARRVADADSRREDFAASSLQP
ncbi:MAG: hypothetical protein H4O13_05205 [Xanthomonadales bacterium]|nr:hypothetical protein [Xanthomonadales bacterium]